MKKIKKTLGIWLKCLITGHEWETIYTYNGVTYFRCRRCGARGSKS